MADETAQTSLKQLIQGMMGESARVLQGIVKSENPLKIQIVGDDKLTIGPNITYVPFHLTDHTAEVTVSWQAENASDGGDEDAVAPHDHVIAGRKTIMIHSALKAGEKVHVLSFNNGKQYFVLDRVG